MWPGMPNVADGKIYVTTGEAAQYNGPVAPPSSPVWMPSLDNHLETSHEALPPRESVAVAYGTLYIIPGDVTKSVDTISGNEYATDSKCGQSKSNQTNPTKSPLTGDSGEPTQPTLQPHQLGPQTSP